MPVRTQHSDEAALYYITFTCYKWLPLFEITNGYDLVYKWFNYLKEEKRVSVTGYVIMPNHLHCILFFPERGFSLNTIISNAKRFMAYEMISRLKNQGRADILQLLAAAVRLKEQKKGQLHRVFQDSFDGKAIYTKKFFYQKLNYIHLNPVRGNWQLVIDWREYEHSSARYYEMNKACLFTPVHYMELQ